MVLRDGRSHKRRNLEGGGPTRPFDAGLPFEIKTRNQCVIDQRPTSKAGGPEKVGMWKCTLNKGLKES